MSSKITTRARSRKIPVSSPKVSKTRGDSIPKPQSKLITGPDPDDPNKTWTKSCIEADSFENKENSYCGDATFIIGKDETNSDFVHQPTNLNTTQTITTRKKSNRKPLSPIKTFKTGVANLINKISPLKTFKSPNKHVNLGQFDSPSKSINMMKLNLNDRPSAGSNFYGKQPSSPIPTRKLPEEPGSTPPKLLAKGLGQTPTHSIDMSPRSILSNSGSPRFMKRKQAQAAKTKRNILQDDVRAIYSDIKAKLTTSNDSELVGREEELEKIREFIKISLEENDKIQATSKVTTKTRKKLTSEAIKFEKSHAIYVSGKPGTGKTLSICNLKADHNKLGNYKSFNLINCMSASSTITNFYQEIYSKILSAGNNSKTTEKMPRTIKTLQSKIEQELLINSHILVLDEIDQLGNEKDRVGTGKSSDLKRSESIRSTASIKSVKSIRSNASSVSSASNSNNNKNQQALIWLFTLATRSKLILISIANTLDFTSRATPELYGLLKESDRPELMNFKGIYFWG